MITNFLRCSLKALTLVICISLAVAQDQNPNIVIMLDLTGSTGPEAFEAEKEATRSLLTEFANSAVRPRVSIGTFNNPPPGDNPATAARIQPGGSLTTDYGDPVAGTGLYGVLNALPQPEGFTDIAAAITVAQTELELNSTNVNRFIVLVTDGVTNRPGPAEYGECNFCGCENADLAAQTAATSVRAKGTRLVAIHSVGNPDRPLCEGEVEQGINFLRTKLLTNESELFLNQESLTPIFGAVSCSVSCSDGNPCTIDSCDDTTGECVFTPSTSDIDGDGVLDCQDSCRGPDALLGQACNVSQGSCVVSGTFGCGATGDVTCIGSSNIVAGCCSFTTLSTTDPVKTIKQQTKRANRTLKSLKRILKRVGVKRIKKALRVKRTVRNAAKLALDSLPAEALQCQDAVQVLACPSVSEAANIEAIKAQAKAMRKALRKGKRLLRQAGYDRKQQNAATRAGNKALRKVNKAIRLLPETRSVCL